MATILSPPQSISELLQRAKEISGMSLGELAQYYQVQTTVVHKGWSGQLLEIALGADARSRSEPDFMGLGVELKTLPINQQGQPRESTFICAIAPIPDPQWQGSSAQRKLATILWVPILTENHIPLLQRRISTPLLWSPSPLEEQLLREDWEELTELVMLGKVAELTALHGQALQIRPKAAHSRILRHAVDDDGIDNFIIPRGFYLRAGFTAQIIRNNYLF